CAVIPGEQQAPVVHALAHAMNHALGNIGHTVIHTDPVEATPVDQLGSLRSLIQDMEQDKVQVLVILGGNPVYTSPVDLEFARYLERVGLPTHLGLYADETANLCHWHIPEAHYLESWGDARAFDGTASIIQPLIAPLYGGKSIHELVSVITDPVERTG